MSRIIPFSQKPSPLERSGGDSLCPLVILPLVLSEAELERLFAAISYLKHRALLVTIYSAGHSFPTPQGSQGHEKPWRGTGKGWINAGIMRYS